MEVRMPPIPEYREQEAVPTREYRVVFWQHQIPPASNDTPPDEVGWAELTLDLVDVEDVHEAIAWAEDHIDKELDKHSGEGPHGERVYVLYAKVPDEDWYVHIAGWDPVASSDAPEANLHRKHP